MSKYWKIGIMVCAIMGMPLSAMSADVSGVSPAAAAAAAKVEDAKAAAKTAAKPVANKAAETKAAAKTAAKPVANKAAETKAAAKTAAKPVANKAAETKAAAKTAAKPVANKAAETKAAAKTAAKPAVNKAVETKAAAKTAAKPAVNKAVDASKVKTRQASAHVKKQYVPVDVPVQPLKEVKVRQEMRAFAKEHARRFMVLRQSEAEYPLHISVPYRLEPSAIRAHIVFTNSNALLKGRSQLRLRWNGGVFAQAPLDLSLIPI